MRLKGTLTKKPDDKDQLDLESDRIRPKKIIYESDIESALVRRVRTLGGLCEKFTSPAKVSVPDRIVTMPGGRICFVECKRPGAKPTRSQSLDHEIRRKLGCIVFIVDTLEGARNFTF